VTGVQIRKHFKFEAAHALPHHTGKCSRMHGHSYRLEVALQGPLHTSGVAQGMVEDFDVISRIVREAVIEPLDHSCLNDILPNPTAELIAQWIWERLEPKIPGLFEAVLWETATACAVVYSPFSEVRTIQAADRSV
jgi:6-pyruvoyltetrahydropterin/6-carboxytetrahydropterin synthase